MVYLVVSAYLVYILRLQQVILGWSVGLFRNLNQIRVFGLNSLNKSLMYSVDT